MAPADLDELRLALVDRLGDSRAPMTDDRCAVDILIALTTLVLALLVIEKNDWPAHRAWKVAALSTFFGVSFTIFSKWLNVSVRSAWAYSEYMPVISVGGLQIGASPLLQWIVIPAFAPWVAVGRG